MGCRTDTDYGYEREGSYSQETLSEVWGRGSRFALYTYRASEKRGVCDRERNKNKAKHKHMVNIEEEMSALLSPVQ